LNLILYLETREISQRSIVGEKPSNRDAHQRAFKDGKLFIFGGRFEDQSKFSCDLWVLELSQMKWKKLKDQVFDEPHTSSSWMVECQDQLLFCSIQNAKLKVLSYDIENDSWADHPWTSLLPDNSISKVIGGQDSIVLLNELPVFSLKLQSKREPRETPKTKKSVQKEKLQDFMTNLFNEKVFADVIFKVEDQEFPANKCVLSLRCSYFKNMFSSNMMESQTNIITVPNIRAKVFQALLQHLYFSDVELDGDVAEELFLLAHEYMLNDLQESCQDDLIRNINVENVIRMTLLAEKYEAEILKKACLLFINKNAEKVYLTQDITSLGGKILFELKKTN